jgi:hypothetical protein
MAHLLYRPHIDHGDKIVTTDFLIREIGLALPDDSAGDLPVDLASNALELAARGQSALVAPVLFLFAGDNEPFAAPAFALLDERLHLQDPVIAWQHARLSIARRAIATEGQRRIECQFEDAVPMFVQSDSLRGVGRFRGAVHPCGAARQIPLQSCVRLTLAAGATVEHRLTLTPLGTGATE